VPLVFSAIVSEPRAVATGSCDTLEKRSLFGSIASWSGRYCSRFWH